MASSSVWAQTWPSFKVSIKAPFLKSYALNGALLTRSAPLNTAKMPERLGMGGGPVRTAARAVVLGSAAEAVRDWFARSWICAWGAGDRPSWARSGWAAP